MKIVLTLLTIAGLIGASALQAQGPPPGYGPEGGWDRDARRGPPPRHSGLSAPPGKWWWDPELVRGLSLSPDQQKRIDDIYQQNRIRLIDLSASLQKEQSRFEPLLSADHPDEARALAQIDRVAQARAELEKANSRMLLSFRNVLNLEQWRKLQNETWHPPRGDRP